MERQAINLCKLLVIGKSGVGKSSFCNYVFGEEKMKVGKGKPVTGWEENLESIDIEHDNLTIRVFDTVGIEADNFERWKKTILEFVKANKPLHDYNYINRSIELDPSNWLQGVFLLINASSGRVEPVETDILRTIIMEYRLPFQIILTNCDVADEDKIDKIEEKLKKDIDEIQKEINNESTLDLKKNSIFKVCSVSKRYRTGIHEAYGKEDVLNQFVYNSYLYTSKYIGLHVLDTLIELIRTLQLKITRSVKSSKFNVFNFDNLENIIDNNIDDLTDTIEGKIESLGNFSGYLEAFGVYCEDDPFDDICNKIEDVMNNIDEENIALLSRLENIVFKFEHGTFIEKIDATIKSVDLAIRFKKHIIDSLDDMFESITHSLYKIKFELNPIGLVTTKMFNV